MGSNETTDRAATSPVEVDRLFVHFMAEGDLDALLALYDPEIVFCDRTGEQKQGLQAMRESLAPLAAAKARFHFDVKRVIESGEIALVHNAWTVSGPHAESGHAIEVMRRRPDGTWRFLIGDPFTVASR